MLTINEFDRILIWHSFIPNSMKTDKDLVKKLLKMKAAVKRAYNLKVYKKRKAKK